MLQPKLKPRALADAYDAGLGRGVVTVSPGGFSAGLSDVARFDFYAGRKGRNGWQGIDLVTDEGRRIDLLSVGFFPRDEPVAAARGLAEVLEEFYAGGGCGCRRGEVGE